MLAGATSINQISVFGKVKAQWIKALIAVRQHSKVRDFWWIIVRIKAATIKQFYLTDLSQFGSDIMRPLLNDLYIFLTVKDKSYA